MPLPNKITVPTRSASMSIGSARLPNGPEIPVMPSGEYVRWLNNALGNIGYALNQLLSIPEIQAALSDLDTATQAAQAAAVAANTAATDAQAANEATAREQALINSYIEPESVVTFDGTLIQIAAHTRFYADGTSAAVSAGNVAPVGTGTRYVSYSDPTRAGGTVSYLATSTPTTQTGDTHNVGGIEVPVAGTAMGGRGPLRPGNVGVQP